MKQVPAVLLSCHRPKNVVKIVDWLREFRQIGQILVWHNGEDPPPVKASRRVKVHWNKNVFTLGRFQASLLFDDDWFYTQDDDVLADEECVQRLVQSIEESETNRISSALQFGHFHTDERRHWGPAHEVLLGWGAVLNRKAACDALNLYAAHHGKDEIYHRKADRIVSILQGRAHWITEASFVELPGASDPRTALWQRKDHHPLTIEARRKCLNILGVIFREEEIVLV